MKHNKRETRDVRVFRKVERSIERLIGHAFVATVACQLLLAVAR